MIALFTAALGAPVAEPTPETPLFPTSKAVLVVFEDIPDAKLRLKTIRYAMRKQPSIVGGRNWGRALCFNFNGDRDLEIIELALAKSKLSGEVREADNCQEPPKEAFMPPVARASRLVPLPPGADYGVARTEFASLLDLEIGITAIRVPRDADDKLCIEFDDEPDEAALRGALDTLSFKGLEPIPVDDCVSALTSKGDE